jgi:hypothetical protein
MGVSKIEGIGLLIVALFSIVYMLDMWLTTGRDHENNGRR